MTTAVTLLGAILVLWAATALYCRLRLGVSLHQAVLYAPLKLFFRTSEGAVGEARSVQAPVIYAVWHQSRLEPALMLALLPEDTLHILDEDSARAWWLDPWRALARNIVFNATHVFVSRRLVRRLRGGGRLAVYLPDDEAPDPKTFRLFRAVARIAAKAEAKVVPIHVEGAGGSFFALEPRKRRRMLPRLKIVALEPMTIAEMVARAGPERPMASSAMFARMMEARRGTAAKAPGAREAA